MPLDPQIAGLIDLINAAAADAPPMAQQTPAMRREGYEKLLAAIPPGPEMASVTDLTASVAGTQTVPVRAYRPTDGTTDGVIVFFHGGGFCIGSIDTHDEVCRQLAAQSGATVVSVEYRLAPEHPFPAGVDDCWTALRWAWAERDALTGDDGAAVAVCGDSAGANLSAVMALMARDDSAAEVEVAVQLLVYPAVDMRSDAPYPSLAENGEGYVLTAEGMEWFTGNYLGDRSLADDWRASPLLASSLAGVAPALVVTAEFDPLRDEGAAYVAALSEAGVDVTHTLYEGMVHIFFQLGQAVDSTRSAIAEVSATARRYLQTNA